MDYASQVSKDEGMGLFRFYRHIAVCTVSVTVLLFAAFDVCAETAPGAYQYMSKTEFKTQNQIDRLILEELENKSLKPAYLCSDEVFIRRAYLDVTGTLPPTEDIIKFYNNPRSDKRASLINALLRSPEYADYFSLKWCDLLRVKAEFPINLWPNAVQAYHRWIHDAVAENISYDRFARELLTSSGSNFRVPAVNFYRAMQGHEPATIANTAALTFMGTRLDTWPDEKRKNLEAFFSRVSFKSTAEWKEEIVYLNPEQFDSMEVVFPDGTKTIVEPGQDPRAVFADWLIKPENEWFAKNIVNRIWSWLFGRGIIHEPDDIRNDNPPVHPKVLEYLEKELIESGYDVKHVLRLILNSSTYQQSSVSRCDPEQAGVMFACYPVRQLDAEVLIDALCYISGTTESYSSPIPEPFTFIPEEQRSIDLADGSITSQFLEMFGRPGRDTGLESERNNKATEAQRMHLLNSSHIRNKIIRGPKLRNLAKKTKWKKNEIVKQAYLNVLSRYPTESENIIAKEYFNTDGVNTNQAAQDLIWALINSKEFLYRH